MGKLTDLKIRQAKPLPGKRYQLADGNGLYGDILPSAIFVWRYRYRLKNGDGKLAISTIGRYPEISLAEAREQHAELRKIVNAGADPRIVRAATLAKKKAEQANTFQAVASLWIAKKASGWTPYYKKQIDAGFANHVHPKIGNLPMASITSSALFTLLEPVSDRAPAVAVNLKIWIGAVFRFAIKRQLIAVDPTTALRGDFTRGQVTHHPRLTPEQIPDFIRKVDAYQGIAGHALKILLHTFVRPSELRCAVWTEIDLDQALWRIPAPRMKSRREHLVPLSPQVVTMFSQLRALTGHSKAGLLFPNQRDHSRPMSNTSTNRALEYMGYAGVFSSHGFRSTASSLLNEAGFHPDVIEMQLAHLDRDQSRASYNHAQYLEQRRGMMNQWSNYLGSLDEQGSCVTSMKSPMWKAA